MRHLLATKLPFPSNAVLMWLPLKRQAFPVHEFTTQLHELHL